jgi:signal transduction histidine kinase/HD-like signal output (HDOD) protein
MDGRRVELILQQLDSLPTLSTVAVRVIELTTDESSQADDVIAVISSDPALAGKVLQVSRRIDRARAENITTIERAVLHLGYDAVRSIVLSVQIFELFNGLHGPGGEEGEADDESEAFDRVSYWHHCLAVAWLSQELAKLSRFAGPPALPGVTLAEEHSTYASGQDCRAANHHEAFLAGLLHDVGLLALHVLLPRSIDRACKLAESNGVSIDHVCARTIGLTATTAGKRLAERWNLPRSITDVLWLRGQRLESLPALPHRDLIGIVTLADVVARARYITPAGHAPRGENVSELCRALDVDPSELAAIVERLPREVAERAASIGLDESPDAHMLLRALGRANAALGRVNAQRSRTAQLAHSQIRTLRRIISFHESAPALPDALHAALERVIASASEALGRGFYAMLIETRSADWQLVQFASDGRILRSDIIAPPQGAVKLADLADHSHMSVRVMGMLPWLSDYLGDSRDLREVRLLPLRNGPSGTGISGVLLHDRPVDGVEGRDELEAMTRTWAAAVAAGSEHEAARALGEELAEANRMLIETQDALTRTHALAALGEIVAGAAHEMNNPLAVISGRAQLLAKQITEPSLAEVANLIATQAHRLSDMITTLRSLTEPAASRRKTIDLGRLIMRIVSRFEPEPDRRRPFTVTTVISDNLPEVLIDAEQVGEALFELVRNAAESRGVRHIELRVQIDPFDDRLKIQVRDDGSGLSEHALAHAFEPFFSEKPAGRQPGLGLARARRYVHAHGGRLTLENGPSGGAVATIWLDQWRAEDQKRRDAA